MTLICPVGTSIPAHSTRPGAAVMVARRPGRNLTEAWLACDDTISRRESERIRAFHRWEDAISSLLARRLMIDLVATTLDSAPGTVTLGREANGRPIVTSARHDGVDVNAAHAGEWVAAAISTRGRIGVDLEVERPIPDGLAARCCTAAELDWVHGGSPAPVEARFFQLWTLKEALLKAIGQGLAIDPRALSFDLSIDQPPTLRVAPAGIDPDAWQFVTWQPLPGLWLSVASDGDLPPTYTFIEDIAA